MSDELLLQCASPTLAALKVGSLISYRTTDSEALLQTIALWNARLNPKGVAVTLLQQKSTLFLVYVHRPLVLAQHLLSEEVQHLLRPLGYSSCKMEESLSHLQDRLANEVEFPHEIGLFLGYPPSDVAAFMQNKGCNGKCDGCWKVYSDVQQAKITFARYKKCTRLYLNAHGQGKKLEDLTVRRKET